MDSADCDPSSRASCVTGCASGSRNTPTFPIPMPRIHRQAATLVIALAALRASRAGAQQGAPADTAQRFAIDTLAVRVLRTPLPPLRAPFAVSVTGGEAQRRAKPGLALNEPLAAIPGVQVENRFNYALGERIAVRGLGARAQFGVRGVRVLVDGIPATMPDGQTTLNQVDLGSLGGAEVVRGPASALYGNASGGVIRLVSAPPPPVPFGSEYQVTGGSDGLLRLRSAVGGNAGGVAYQASLSRLRYDGFRSHQRADNTLGSARVGF